MEFRATVWLAASLLAVATAAHGRDAALERVESTATEPAAGASGTETPAWKTPGFVMDEVTATTPAVEFEVRAPERMDIDLEALRQLHRSLPRLDR